jgi:hypothetical protein
MKDERKIIKILYLPAKGYNRQGQSILPNIKKGNNDD